MEAIRSFIKKWGVTISVVGTVVVIGFGLGQCSYDLSTREVEVNVVVPEKTEDPGAPSEESAAETSESTEKAQ